jgi:hypothetical protein
MSDVSSIGSESGLVQMLQQARQGKPVQTKDQGRTQFEAKAKAAGVDVDALKSLHDEMHTAVQDALKNAGPNADRQKTVQAAIDGVLQKHGIDPAKLKSQFESAGLKPLGQYDASGRVGGHKGHHHQAQSAQPQQAKADADNDGSGAVAAVFDQANAGSLVDVAA